MGCLGRRGALKAARAARPAPPGPGDATRAGGFAEPRVGQSRERVASGGAARPGVDLSGGPGCEIPAWECQGISRCQNPEAAGAERAVPKRDKLGWNERASPPQETPALALSQYLRCCVGKPSS